MPDLDFRIEGAEVASAACYSYRLRSSCSVINAILAKQFIPSPSAARSKSKSRSGRIAAKTSESYVTCSASPSVGARHYATCFGRM